MVSSGGEDREDAVQTNVVRVTLIDQSREDLIGDGEMTDVRSGDDGIGPRGSWFQFKIGDRVEGVLVEEILFHGLENDDRSRIVGSGQAQGEKLSTDEIQILAIGYSVMDGHDQNVSIDHRPSG